MPIDILHTASDSFQPRAGYTALKDPNKVECFLKQSLNGAILLEGCHGKHRPLKSTGRQRLSHSFYKPNSSAGCEREAMKAEEIKWFLKCDDEPQRGWKRNVHRLRE